MIILLLMLRLVCEWGGNAPFILLLARINALNAFNVCILGQILLNFFVLQFFKKRRGKKVFGYKRIFAPFSFYLKVNYNRYYVR